MVTIKGEKKTEKETKEKDYYHAERSYGSFARSVELPFEIDASKVTAVFDKGVLTVRGGRAVEPAHARWVKNHKTGKNHIWDQEGRGFKLRRPDHQLSSGPLSKDSLCWLWMAL